MFLCLYGVVNGGVVMLPWLPISFYVQVYNETIRDLLAPSGSLNLREDSEQGAVVVVVVVVVQIFNSIFARTFTRSIEVSQIIEP